MIPTLTTERLKLRGWRAEDIEPFSKFMADPDAMRYLTGEPMNRPGRLVFLRRAVILPPAEFMESRARPESTRG